MAVRLGVNSYPKVVLYLRLLPMLVLNTGVNREVIRSAIPSTRSQCLLRNADITNAIWN
jgi:hypothetical protein